MHIDAVKNTLFLGEVGRGEREGGGNRAGVHVAADLELVGTLREGGLHALLLLGGGDFGENHLLAEDGLDLLLDEFELVERICPEGDVETKAEEAFGADLELVAKLFGVVDLRLELWVADTTALGIDVHGSLELGDLFAEVFHDDAGVDGVNIHGDIEDFVDIDERREPAGVEGAGVAVNVESAAVFSAEAEMVGENLDRRGGDEVAESGDSLLEGALDGGIVVCLALRGNLRSGKLFSFFSHCSRLLS